MKDFTLHLSTKLFFGENSEFQIGAIIDEYGFENILIITGQNSVFKSGLIDIVTNSLDNKNIRYHLYKGVTPNPEIIYVNEALALAKEQKIDMILAIGGGSVIDVAKLVAVAYFYDGDPLDYSKHLVEAKASIPLGVILTHAAAGSEMSTSSVISDSKNQFKQGFNTQFNRPLFAIENPKYTLTLSNRQTAIGIVDIMMHTLERYFNESEEGLLADALAEALLKNVVFNANRLLKDYDDSEARANIMLANTFSHNGITGMGKPQRMPVHMIEHGLSALFPEIPHGAGLAVIFPAWARHYQKIDPKKFDALARNVFNLHHPDPDTNGKLGIKALETLFSSLGLDLTLRGFNLKEEDIDRVARLVTKNGHVEVYHYIQPLDYHQVVDILRDCY